MIYVNCIIAFMHPVAVFVSWYEKKQKIILQMAMKHNSTKNLPFSLTHLSLNSINIIFHIPALKRVVNGGTRENKHFYVIIVENAVKKMLKHYSIHIQPQLSHTHTRDYGKCFENIRSSLNPLRLYCLSLTYMCECIHNSISIQTAREGAIESMFLCFFYARALCSFWAEFARQNSDLCMHILLYSWR